MIRTRNDSRIEIWGSMYINKVMTRTDDDDNAVVIQAEHADNDNFIVEIVDSDLLVKSSEETLKLKKELDAAYEKIERLNINYCSMQSTLAKMSMGVEQAKAEAIKEFAERLKSYAHEISCNVLLVVTKDDIDNLVKEMVGDTE